MVSADQIHRLSFDDVVRMYETGVLTEQDRVELIDGVLVDMSPAGAGHSGAVAWLNRHFTRGAGDLEVRVQDTLLIPGGFLEPDLFVVDPLPRDRLPSTARLVVEVAQTSQRHDAWKAARYARVGVGEYWVVDLVAREVTVHREPRPDAYGQVASHRDGERIPTPVGAPDVDVTELLGPRS